MQERIVELLAKLPDGELTEQLLIVNDDLNNLFLRFVNILAFYEQFTILQVYYLRYRYSRYEKNREAECSTITVDGKSKKATDLLQGFIDEPIATTSNQFSKLSNYAYIYISYCLLFITLFFLQSLLISY